MQNVTDGIDPLGGLRDGGKVFGVIGEDCGENSSLVAQMGLLVEF